MIKTRVLFLLALAAVVFSLPYTGFAQNAMSEGERLGKTCAGCHGTDGNTPGFYIGKIGGQNGDYMAKALKEFSAKKRPKSIEMTIISKGYTDKELESIAMWYAAKKWVNSTNPVDTGKAAKGKAISEDNGCMDCHGENGEGMDEYPRVGGQNIGYLYEVMKRYRSGAIESDEMSMVTEFSDEQLEQLANYMSSLRK